MIAKQIKEHAYNLGFDACGICKAEAITGEDRQNFLRWVDSGYHAGMEYMARNADKRLDPKLLVENARSVICVALNYYPPVRQPEAHPQFAYYAYGEDYHDIMREKLNLLLDYVRSMVPSVVGRGFVDTAPVMERYWAAKAGLGFTGKNSLLIIPKKGSFFFLGELIVDLELEYDPPLNLSCGSCTRCLDACPTHAIVSPNVINSCKCASYQTIENKGEIDTEVLPNLSNRLYGCDICQQACPWNRYARPHKIPEFTPSQAFLDLSVEKLASLTEDEYRHIFKGSAVKRAKFNGLKRNLSAILTKK